MSNLLAVLYISVKARRLTPLWYTQALCAANTALREALEVEQLRKENAELQVALKVAFEGSVGVKMEPNAAGAGAVGGDAIVKVEVKREEL